MLKFSLCLADKLQELLDKAEGPEALPDERKEMEELKALLPEIQEKVEDATDGLKTASAAAAEAMKGVLVSQGWGRFHSHVKRRDSLITLDVSLHSEQ